VFLATPLRLYVILLGTIFLCDLLQETISPTNAGRLFTLNLFADAFITTLCAAPLLWLLVVRPLKRAASSEKVRTAAVRAQVMDAIVAVDCRGTICSFNPAAERIFGYSAQQMIGASAAALLDQGREGLEPLLAGADDRPGEEWGAPFTEIVCRSRDRLALVVDVSVSKVLLEGENPEYLLIMRDITSRKRMEEALRESETRFKEIFHQSEEAILFFKPGSSVILDANANAEHVFGFSKAELQSGGLQQIAEPEDLPALSRAVQGIAEWRQAQLEFRCRRKDGQQIVVSLRGKIMLLQGVPITYCTFRDVSERIRTEERTRDIQAKLIHANKMTSLGLLVSGVAHEINNPNNFIMANAELLEKISLDSLKALKEHHPEGEEFYIAGLPFAELDAHCRRLFEGIVEGSRRVNDIVQNMKGFARQERRAELREVDVNEVARSAVSLMHHELIRFTDNFHLELAEPAPLVMGHGQQLGQVIINLLMNACQALPGRQAGIWLSTAFDREKDMVAIAVRDEGSGMSKEECRRIMEPFFTTKLDNGGTGLGLSISESIVKEHGGTLEYDSVSGSGTVFEVWLPVAGSACSPSAAGEMIG
jgi:PAS domain S-box-containing protein